MVRKFLRLFRADGRHDENGYEHLDPTPVKLPIDFQRPLSLEQRIAQMLRSQELARAMAAHGRETFEEADDFDVEDEFEDEFAKSSPYEENFDQVNNWNEAKRHTKEQMNTPPRQPKKAGKFQEEEPVERPKKAKKAPPKKELEESEDPSDE